MFFGCVTITVKGGVSVIVDADYQILLPLRDRKYHDLSRPVENRILDLERRGLLELNTRGENGVDARGIHYQKSIRVAIITIAGLDALTVFEEVAHEKTEYKREKRLDRKFQVILVLISFFIGLFVEHFSQIIGVTFALFRSLNS